MVVRFKITTEQGRILDRYIEKIQILFHVVIVVDVNCNGIGENAVQDVSDSGPDPVGISRKSDEGNGSAVKVEIHGDENSKAKQYLIRLISENKREHTYPETFLNMVEKKLGALERKFDICINRSSSTTLELHGSDEQLTPVVALLKECYSYFQAQGTVPIDRHTADEQKDSTNDSPTFQTSIPVLNSDQSCAISPESPYRLLSPVPSGPDLFSSPPHRGYERELTPTCTSAFILDYAPLDKDSIDRFGFTELKESNSEDNLAPLNMQPQPLIDSTTLDTTVSPLAVYSQNFPASNSTINNTDMVTVKTDLNNSEVYNLSPSTEENQQNSRIIEEALKLGYVKEQVEPILKKLGPNPDYNDVLGALVAQGPSPVRLEEEDVAGAADEDDGENLDGEDNLKPIIIDGSNIAMSYGNNHEFAIKGILIVVNWFVQRGHKKIYVIIPSWRKEKSPNGAEPITDQHLLKEMEEAKIIVYTPSRRVKGHRIVSYDDRYIVKAAIQVGGGIIVSNDQFRDLLKEDEDFKKIIEENLLMYSFVDGKFMPPDDPLGRRGPCLDDFLRKRPLRLKQNTLRCPYGERCTYGNRCKYDHPERKNKPMPSISATIRRNSQPAVKTWRTDQSQTQPLPRRNDEWVSEGARTEPLRPSADLWKTSESSQSSFKSDQTKYSSSTFPLAQMSSSRANRPSAPYSESVTQPRYDLNSASTNQRYQQSAPIFAQTHDYMSSSYGMPTSREYVYQSQYSHQGHVPSYSSDKLGTFPLYQQPSLQHQLPDTAPLPKSVQYQDTSSGRRLSLQQQHAARHIGYSYSNDEIPDVLRQMQEMNLSRQSSSSDILLPEYQYMAAPSTVPRLFPSAVSQGKVIHQQTHSDFRSRSSLRPPPGLSGRQQLPGYEYAAAMYDVDQTRSPRYHEAQQSYAPFAPLKSGQTEMLSRHKGDLNPVRHDPSLTPKQQAKRKDIYQKLVHGPLKYDPSLVKYALEIDPMETETTNIIYRLRELQKR